MSLTRKLLLIGSQSAWLRKHASRYWFMKRSVERFMPGETTDDALAAAAALQQQGISTVLTLLGENVTQARDADAVRKHYEDVLCRIRESALPAEVSVKLTQLGLDIDEAMCQRNVEAIADAAGPDSTLWIDMESSAYTDRTLDLYRRALGSHSNLGVCLQAYLYRTADDLTALITAGGGAVRLVKGAYNEPPSVAYPKKQDVDENFYRLAGILLSPDASAAGMRVAFGTHDRALIARIAALADSSGVSKRDFEFQMLYGIQRNEQLRLAREGWRTRVLVSYGSYWFPWFMRRLAERPANVWFVARNLFS